MELAIIVTGATASIINNILGTRGCLQFSELAPLPVGEGLG